MAKRRDVSYDTVRDLFDYDRGSGFLIWKKPKKRVAKGSIVSNISHDGYLNVRVNGIRYRAHRIIFLWARGYLPDLVEHRDLDKTNNKLHNLRPATHSQNMCNTRSRNLSGLKGVYDTGKKLAKPYTASITVDRKGINLGYFSTKEEAHKAYCEAAAKYHGKFARFE
jgi:hypothetical protein